MATRLPARFAGSHHRLTRTAPHKTMTPTETAVRDRLAEVADPGLDAPIDNLGLVRDVRITPERIVVALALNAPFAPEERRIVDRVHAALADLDRPVRVEAASLPTNSASGECPRGVSNVVGVINGTAGAGKSQVTVAAATELAARGARVGILDADPTVSASSRLLGVTATPEVDETGQVLPPDPGGIKVLSVGDVLGCGGITVAQSSLHRRLLTGFLRDVAWRPLDYLFVELPSGVDDATLALPETDPIVGNVVVTSANALAVDETHRYLSKLRERAASVLGVVETRPADDDGESNRPRPGRSAEPAAAVGEPVLESLPLDPSARRLSAEGDPPREESSGAATAALADALTNEVGRRQRRAVAREAGGHSEGGPDGSLSVGDESHGVGSVRSG